MGYYWLIVVGHLRLGMVDWRKQSLSGCDSLKKICSWKRGCLESFPSFSNLLPSCPIFSILFQSFLILRYANPNEIQGTICNSRNENCFICKICSVSFCGCFSSKRTSPHDNERLLRHCIPRIHVSLFRRSPVGSVLCHAAGECVPLRVFLKPYALTPTYRATSKFSVKYFLNLVLVDEEDRR